MSETVIKVEHLSKKYQLGTIGTGALTKDLNLWWHKIRGKKNPYAKVDENGDFENISEHFALNDVSFEIKQSDAVGIIGKNGAGKSTLLKILSRITTPTSGNIKVKGKVASLLEVGTGFSGELTGKENIYLNGAILGMSKAYINSRLDEIIDFSGVEKYIDTPVKRYSSGMYVRLAFAVAAHLEPEILIVDEVLAVGDAEFQKKCLGKMNDVNQKDGRTVLFVSHDMNSIARLCNHALYLEKGSVRGYDLTNKIIGEYLSGGTIYSSFRRWEMNERPGNKIVKLNYVGAFDHTNEESLEVFDIRNPIKLRMEYEVLEKNSKLTHAFVFHNEKGVRLFDSHDVNSEWKSNSERKVGTYVAELIIPGNFFSEGKVKISPAVITSDPFNLHFYEEDIISFYVKDTLDGNSARGEFVGNYLGLIRPLFNWESKLI